VRRAWPVLACAATLAGAGMARPPAASAHAVGGSTPVASSYAARIMSVPPGIQAAVVDGDLVLWMVVNPRLTVIVTGMQGEPYLRFSASGVDENQRSPTTYQNRAIPVAPPAGLNPKLPPVWKHVTSAHSYMWHEDRLHALAVVARAPSTNDIGQWTIPLRVDGRRTQITGRLWYQPDPTWLWFWPLIVVAASLPALLRIRHSRITNTLRWTSSAVTLAAIVIARLGRELYGHPSVSTLQMVDLVLTCVVAAGIAGLLLNRQWWPVMSFIIGAFGLYEGLQLLPTLTHGLVLASTAPWVERAATITCMAGGGTILLAWLLMPLEGEN
jgi:hypothetical protein